MLECNTGLLDQSMAEDVKRWKFQPVPLGQEWRIDVIKDIISMRDNRRDGDIVSKDELNAILEYICTT